MIKTPYYLIDKQKLLVNMQKIAYVREQSGAKALLALKCFATWSVFDLMQQYMDGTTSSSLYELKLGRQSSKARPTPTAWLGPTTKSRRCSTTATRSSSTPSVSCSALPKRPAARSAVCESTLR